ncbi:MAG: AbrB/MazE/SpoVT family DNA-binding domain-containing protein [Desulfuromonadaceae bacterium]
MRVTSKGQVTIPNHIRRKLGIQPQSEVEFIEQGDQVVLVKKMPVSAEKSRFRKYRGMARKGLSTAEIMALTRGE